MTTDERIANFKYSVLQHAYKHKNVTSTVGVKNLWGFFLPQKII